MNNFPGLWFNFHFVYFFCCILMRFYDLQFSKACTLMSYVFFKVFSFIFLTEVSIPRAIYLCTVSYRHLIVPVTFLWHFYLTNLSISYRFSMSPYHIPSLCNIEKIISSWEKGENSLLHWPLHMSNARRKWSSGKGWILDGNTGFRVRQMFILISSVILLVNLTVKKFLHLQMAILQLI